MKRYTLSLASSMLGLSVVASPAFAQEAPQANTDSTLSSGEIIVTAQRRAQSVMTVPLSIQAVTGDQLVKSGLKDITSLQFSTPGFVTQSNSGFTQVYIRGVGNAIYLGADPSVATFVDDVPRIYGSMADNFVDVARVEVLKGAQGGLYGRNATGGVVNIITREPSLDGIEAEGRFSYGTKKTFRASGYFNLPISDIVAVSVTAERDSHDNYVKNQAIDNPYSAANFPGGAPAFGLNPQQTAAFFNAQINPPKANDQDFWAVRGKVLIKPADNVKIVLAGDYYKKNDNNGQGVKATLPGVTQAALVNYFAGLGINAVLPPGFVKGGTGKFAIAVGNDSHVIIPEYGLSATITWNAPGFDLTSITAHRHQRTDSVFDVNTASVPTFPLSVQFTKKFTYQEIRAVSTFDGPLHLLGGFTYLDNKLSGNTDVSYLTLAIPASSTEVSDHIRNFSAYVQAEYDITDALSLTASGRYLREKNTANFTLPVVSGSTSVETKFIPAATVSYKLNGGNIYARWARGFKTGGINIVSAPILFPSSKEGSVFKGETVDTYEVGYKQSLFDRKVQLTAAVFYNSYKDLQVDVRLKPAFAFIPSATINANSARTYGVEGGVIWHVADPLTLGFNAGYLNAKYKDFKFSGGIAVADFNLDGATMPKSPKFQGSFNADLDYPVTDDLRLVSSLLVSRTSSTIQQHSADPSSFPDSISPAYWLVNARIGVKTANDKYGFYIVADNLFNATYFTFGQASTTGNSLAFGDPRIIRAEISIKM